MIEEMVRALINSFLESLTDVESLKEGFNSLTEEEKKRFLELFEEIFGKWINSAAEAAAEQKT